MSTAIHFDNPRALAVYARDLRGWYEKLGYNPSDCCVGFHDNLLLMADDHGSISYRFMPDGQISRRHNGSPSKLIEMVDIDVARYVTIHNHHLRKAIA